VNTITAGFLRIVKVLVVYAVAGGLLWTLLPAIRRTFLLPALFGTLARGAILVGALLAAAVAWRYPEAGSGRQVDPVVRGELDEAGDLGHVRSDEEDRV
jgi:hypothetical protein